MALHVSIYCMHQAESHSVIDTFINIYPGDQYELEKIFVHWYQWILSKVIELFYLYTSVVLNF